MKRLAFVLLVFALGWLGTPLLRSAGQGEHSPYIVLYSDGTWDYAPLPEGTPTQEGATSTPSATSPQTPSYTPTTTPLTPTPTMTPLPLCAGTITEVGTRLRESPWGTILDTLTADDLPMSIGITARVENNGTWYKATANGQTVYVYATLVTLTETSGCSFTTASTAWGVWAGPGASRDELVTFGDRLKAKGITPAATVYGDAATANLLYSRGWIVAWRPFTGLNCPVFTEPPESNATAAWNDALAHSQGVSFTWLVVCNEPVFPTANYAVRWILTIVDLAERDHVARVVPVVWSPGRPELDEVPALVLALHSDLIQTCFGANLYPAKTGVGLDVFEEWTTYRPLKYPADLPLCVTEFAAGEGGEPPDFAQYPAFVGRYEGRLLWATAWFDAMDLSPWTNANLRGRLDRLARAF